MNTELIKGFKDYSGEQALKREKIKQILVQTFKKYRFEPAETPIIEQESFVTSNNQEDEAVSDTYKLTDKGKRKLALRYEFTFQLKRLAKNKKLPYKRYQIGPVFRDEPASTNRFRQFTQADVDIIGSTIKDEAEILSLTAEILKQLKIKSTILINNRKLLNEILAEQKITNKIQVIKELDKLDKLPEAQAKANLKKYKAEKILSIFKKPESYFKKYSAYSEIAELKKYCKLYNIKINFQPSLARGLSYYTGNVFEIKSDLKESICGGGSYLINNIPSTGITLGLERLSSLAQLEVEDTSYLIISLNQDKAAIKLAKKLRDDDSTCQIYYGKISKGLEYANSNKIENVIFLGKEEVKKRKLKLKNMKTGKEKLVSEKELIR